MFYNFARRLRALVGGMADGPGPAAQPGTVITLNLTVGGDATVRRRQEASQVDRSALGFYMRIGEVIGEAIVEHEERFHVPPPERGPLQAIPFADVTVSDIQVARALELLSSGSSIFDVAEVLGVPELALERKLAEFRPRWRRFLQDREAAV